MIYKASVLSLFQWTIDIDLQNDLRGQLYRRLGKAGYKDVDEEHAVLQFYKLLKRQIAPRPRRVLYSKEFTCPEKYEQALNEFEEKARRGDDIRPYMSSKLRFADYDDLLLNDWGIQHFHLTRWFNKDGSAKSSNYEIFAYVTDAALHMIQVYHHQAEDLYSKQEMVRIIRDNWPWLIEKFHIDGALELEEKFDDHAYGEIRKAHVGTFVELEEGEIYGMIGGGYASNGFSLEALRNADFWLNRLGTFQKVAVENAVWIGQTINRMVDSDKKYCDMKMKLLWVDNADKVTLCEENTGLILQIDTRKGQLRLCQWHEV